jgi:hypothetical protein
LIPTSGPNVSGTPAGGLLRREENKGPVFFRDVVSGETREREKPVVVPEPLKRVRVLAPFQVAHAGTQYFPGEVAEVPQSLANNWILNQWVVSDEPLLPDVVPAEPPRRGRRPTR